MHHIIGGRRRTGAGGHLDIALTFGPLTAHPWRDGIGERRAGEQGQGGFTCDRNEVPSSRDSRATKISCSCAS